MFRVFWVMCYCLRASLLPCLLSPNAALALVHKFVCSRTDYCNAGCMGKGTLISLNACCLQLLDLVVACENLIVSCIFMDDVLHWLHISQCTEFKISTWLWLENSSRYLWGSSAAPPPPSQGWQVTEIVILVFPFTCTLKMQCHAFSVSGPTM